jgi:hypothetical protein
VEIFRVFFRCVSQVGLKFITYRGLAQNASIT